MKKHSKKSKAEERRESGLPGGGAGRKDEVGRSGVYPMSGPHPASDAEIRGQASWGQGERGAAGYEDHGSSELTYEGGQLLGGYSTEEQEQHGQQKGGRMKLTSPAFSHGGSIPKQFTCEGRDISPELSWTEAPKETRSFALILHDPDAPRQGGFTHWLVYNIPANVNRIAEDIPHNGSIEAVGLQGQNDAGKIGYMGPCPPSGQHRYFARLYALRDELALEPGATYAEVIAAMRGKIIEEAELMGTYAKTGRKAA
jgi:Raf kinase inhibitor-like YbhB/YbcL family protein